MGKKIEKIHPVMGPGTGRRYEENIRSLIDDDAKPKNSVGEFVKKRRLF